MVHPELDDLRWLIELAAQEQLAEIEVVCGESAVRVRAGSPTAAAPVAASPAAAAASAPAAPAGTVPVLAPLAGVFYRSPSPAAPPFVEVGDRVQEGEVVGLIDAMKLFNSVEAPVGGTVRVVVAADGGEVGSDDPLMYIEPATNNLT